MPSVLTDDPRTLSARPSTVSRDLSLLHPVFRQSIIEVLKEMKQMGIPFELFEGYRTPQRQSYLYSQGRSRPGTIVTFSKPWESFHQYGLAADFALYLDGKWTWDGGREFDRCWDELRDVGEIFGLRPTADQQPHLQWGAIELEELQKSMYPSGGDETWWENLQLNLSRSN